MLRTRSFCISSLNVFPGSSQSQPRLNKAILQANMNNGILDNQKSLIGLTDR